MFKARSMLLTNRSALLTKFSDESCHDDFDSDIPTPLQFDTFVPWVCSQWCASATVVVVRVNQEEYVRFDPRKTKMPRKGKQIQKAPAPTPAGGPPDASDSEKDEEETERVVVMKTVYNSKRKLVEVSITGSPFTISRRIIQAFSLCIAFHSSLTRITIRKGGLSQMIIYEINKLLPLSHITELCFDDSYVREGNYYILLENMTQLKYLSLNRCGINDKVCCKIAETIEYGNPSAETLQILELGSNHITDVGAKCFGTILKKNRSLLHLNLSGNRITDHGFKFIMDSLKQFPLTTEETIAMRGRRIRYLQKRATVFERCLEELKVGKSDDVDSTTGTAKKLAFGVKRLRNKKNNKRVLDENVTAQADLMARGIVGDFKDPYSPENIVTEDGYLFSKGNITFCSLNVAYNNLDYASLLKVQDVLSYQCEIEKMPDETGLLRITLAGNNIPASCEMLNEIDASLKKMVNDLAPTPRKIRSSLLRKMMSARS